MMSSLPAPLVRRGNPRAMVGLKEESRISEMKKPLSGNRLSMQQLFNDFFKKVGRSLITCWVSHLN